MRRFFVGCYQRRVETLRYKITERRVETRRYNIY